MEGALVDEWCAEPDVTSDELVRQLTQLIGKEQKPILQLPKPGVLLQT